MILVDTSVWIDVLRDASGRHGRTLTEILGDHEASFCRFTQLELLQGCRDEKEWNLLSSYLDSQDYVETTPTTWKGAARIFFDLRRVGLTVRSPIDCCIAQLVIESDSMLLHRDRDFTTIATLRPLRQLRVDWK